MSFRELCCKVERRAFDEWQGDGVYVDINIGGFERREFEVTVCEWRGMDYGCASSENS